MNHDRRHCTFQEEDEQDLLSYQLLIPDLDSTTGFFYNSTHTVAVSGKLDFIKRY
jgi:hypothetical protein